jgi:hypothetical protein
MVRTLPRAPLAPMAPVAPIRTMTVRRWSQV